ncbi:MAG: exodeoxyribonuclease V subunit gamma, partial [Burkholderiaceae bacterium]|nr:exodeoxyribonuclease V subunit gamma [Burkholderiaceae bacterium]
MIGRIASTRCASRPGALELPAGSREHELDRLSALHAAILLRSDRPWEVLADPREDASIQLHATHGAVRSAEVLHDCLLDCFASMPDLHPDQVIVMCADLEDAADAIESVFASAPVHRRVPIAVSPRPARVDPMQRAALELLEFAGGGATLAALEQWLANPVSLEALSLDAEQAGELVAACEAAGVRWGLDEAAGPPKHNWRAGIERLVLGAALGGGAAQIAGVAPTAGLRRVGGEAFERLLALLEAVRGLRELDRAPRPLAHWCAAVRDLFESLFGNARRHADSLARLFASLESLREGAAFEPASAVDAGALRQALADELDRGAGAALPSGAVTVCPIGGLRAIGFRVVALFGLDESAFPRGDGRGEFDLIAAAPRFGDRASGVDDRGVFLDAVLAARERLIVLYTGRDPRDDTTRNPSTPVSELIAYVNARQRAEYPPLQPLVHPLHPFSPRAFASRGDDRATAPASFAAQWEGTARALVLPLHERGECVGALRVDEARSREASSAPAPDDSRDASARPPVDAAELDALRAALADPARAYLGTGLGLSLPYEQGGPQEVEPFAPDAAQDRHLVDSVARRLVAGEDARSLLAELRALAQTAAGAGGEVHARSILASAQAL